MKDSWWFNTLVTGILLGGLLSMGLQEPYTSKYLIPSPIREITLALCLFSVILWIISPKLDRLIDEKDGQCRLDL